MLLERTFDSARRSRYAVPAAIVAALLLLAGNEAAHRRADRIIEGREQTLIARAEINRLLRLVLSAETGQRGYLLTGRAQYRGPYEAALSEVDTLLARLRLLYANPPERQADMRRLEELVRQKLSELATTMRLFDDGTEGLWRELMLTDIGRETMMSIEQLARAMGARESVQLEAARQSLSATLLWQRLGIAALVLLSLVALLLYFREVRSRAVADEQQRAALQSERDKLEAEVLRRTRDITEIARHLQTAREDERSRLARELHDELGALLTAAKLDVARMRSRLGGAGPEVAQRMQHLIGTLDAGIALKRRIIEDLRPSSLQNLGLQPALDILVRELGASSGLAITCEIDQLPPAEHLGAELSLTLYRLVQEALTNAIKYAHASRVQVRVRSSGPEAAQVEVSVRDDGAGFDPDAGVHKAHGLAGMRFRVESHGGRLSIESAPGAGTLIHARLPLAAAEPAAAAA